MTPTTSSTTPPTATSATDDSRDTDDPPRVVRCGTAAEFLAALPRLVGFSATDSLLVVFFHGVRAEGTLRVALPRNHAPAALADYLTDLATHVRLAQQRHGSSAPALVVQTSDALAGAAAAPWLRFAASAAHLLAVRGSAAREVCIVGRDGWYSLTGAGRPLRLRSLAEITGASRATSPAPTLAELGTFPDAPAGWRAACAAAAGQQRPGGTTATGQKRPDLSAAAAVDALTGPTWSAEGAARVLTLLRTHAGWDTLHTQLVSWGLTSAREHQRRPAGQPGPPGTHKLAEPQSTEPQFAEPQLAPPRSAFRALVAASARLRELVSLAAAEERGAVMAACAVAWWARGLESVAHEQCAEAHRISPDDPRVARVRALIAHRSPQLAEIAGDADSRKAPAYAASGVAGDPGAAGSPASAPSAG